MKKTEEVKNWLSLLKGAHQVYQKADNNQRIRLIEKCQWIFDRLEAAGAKPGFCEALVVYGKEFLDAEFPPAPDSETIRLAEHANSQGLTLQEWLKQPATIEDAEVIFQAKAETMSEHEKRAHALAQKHGALVYKILSKEGDPVKIEVLSKVKEPEQMKL